MNVEVLMSHQLHLVWNQTKSSHSSKAVPQGQVAQQATHKEVICQGWGLL